MRLLSDTDFTKELKNPGSGYLFFGEEDYTKLHALSRLREVICPDPSVAAFNDIRIEALDYTPARLLDSLELYPMLGDRKLVTLSGIDLNQFRQDEINSLCEVLAKLPDYDYNTLVICLPDGALDEGRLPARPSATFAKLAEYLTPVAFRKSSPARLAAWVGKHFQFNRVTAPPDVVAKLIDYVGQSMFILASEIDKISWYVLASGRSEVGVEDITAVAVPDRGYDAFAFANSLTVGDRRRALDILATMKQQKIEPTVIMGDISRVFCDMLTVRLLADEGLSKSAIAEATKIHEYRVGLYLNGSSGVMASTLRRITGLCADADANVKLSRGYESIERLICSI